MPSTPRDVLIYAVTAIACVASIASDTHVGDSSLLEALPLEERLVVSYKVTIGPQTAVGMLSELDSGFGVGVFAATDADGADGADELEEVAATLFALDENAARGDVLDVATTGDVFTEGEVVIKHMSLATDIVDCTSAPCVRRFELEIAAPQGFVGEVNTNGGASNYVSESITVESAVRE